MRRIAGIALVALSLGPLPAARAAAPRTPTFSVGAAKAGITPPPYDRATNPAECDPSGAFGGHRKFNLGEPYWDVNGDRQFEVGEP